MTELDEDDEELGGGELEDWDQESADDEEVEVEVVGVGVGVDEVDGGC